MLATVAVAGVTALSSAAANVGHDEPRLELGTVEERAPLVGADGLPLQSADILDARPAEGEHAAAVTLPTASDPAFVPSASRCEDELVTSEALNVQFDTGIGRMVGADYQRAFELDDERVLWVFQDAFFADGLGDPTLAHNAAAIQDGMCFDAFVGGTEQQPESWIAADDTQAFRHWYWPLDGYERDADTFVLYLAEMDERGASYLDNATPVATWTAQIDLTTMKPGELERAPNPNDELYGFEITTDDTHLYLYGQCHRQFGFSYLGHDPCAAEVYIARQPLDDPTRPLEYWNGSTWSRNSRTATNIAPLQGPDGEQRTANPIQIERDGDRWIAVTKADDWWGDTVYFDTAPSPEGPWTTTAALPVSAPGDPDEFAAYFVSFIPSDEVDTALAISSNRWDGTFSDTYHPRFTTVADRVWDEREAVNIGGDVWLPTGEPISQ
ncbi:MAG: hypothetical protein AB8G14_14415 [Ilumatobacter sp.]